MLWADLEADTLKYLATAATKNRQKQNADSRGTVVLTQDYCLSDPFVVGPSQRRTCRKAPESELFQDEDKSDEYCVFDFLYANGGALDTAFVLWLFTETLAIGQ